MKEGRSKDAVLQALRAMKQGDADWKSGKTFSLVYYAGDDLISLLKDAYGLFMSENALSPAAFPSLQRLETEVLAMANELLGGGTGTMTSGGTESIMLAVKTARDQARAERGVTAPEMVTPVSVHPAFDKAAHYFGVKKVDVPLAADLRVDQKAFEAALDANTVLAVGSAPGYPHGVVDPITECAALASKRNILFHVDACLGGFMLPFVKAAGFPVPAFDFSVPGVTSISADIHKYGFAAKGASIVLYKDEALRRHQFFAKTDWPGGLYGSPSLLGTRPGGAIAAAWAALTYHGRDGYLRIARSIMDTTQKLQAGIRRIDGLHILGEPVMGVFAFAALDAATSADTYAIGQAMNERGWHVDMQQLPAALHVMITPAHAAVVDSFLRDLETTTREARQSGSPASSGMGALYGMAGMMPDKGPMNEMILEALGQLYPAQP